MATATDNFNRSNENPLAGDWETITNALALTSNQVFAASAAQCVSAWKASANDFGDDQYSQATLDDLRNNDNAGVAVRCDTAGSGQGYIAKWSNGDGRIYVQKFTGGGSWSNLTSSIETFTGGDVLKLEATTNGSDCDLEVFVNDVSVITITDTSTALTGGQPGLCYEYSAINQTSIDDWEGGDIGGSSGSLTILRRRRF